MKSSSQKQIKLLVLLLFFLGLFFGSTNSSAENNKIFPNYEIRRMENFGEHHDKLFQIVAYKMGLEINKKLPKPFILTGTQITPRRFCTYLGRKVDTIFPYYFFKKNTIVIPETCKLDSLVHELVHYFQVMYRHANLDFGFGPYIENLEMEAKAIQIWFKSKYLSPYKPDHRIAVNFTHQVVSLP
jgi:hypothetical protein